MRRILAFLFLIGIIADSAYASNHEYYLGKSIHMIVGFSAGGGFDIYSRAIARHMPKYIPGKPNIVVENRPGAGGLILANHMYKGVKPDGLTIGNFIGTLLLDEIIGRPGVEFKGLNFEYIGVPSPQSGACAVTKASGIHNMKDWFAAKTPLKLGGAGQGSFVDNTTKIVKTALNLPIQLISGYKGFADIKLAMEGGELSGTCHPWEVFKVAWTNAIQSGDANVILQVTPKPHPDLPKVPLAIDFAKTEEARQLIQVGIYDSAILTRIYSLAPGTPKDRVALLRQAFMNTMKDPEFLGEATKAKLDIDPISGEDVEKRVAALYKLNKSTISKLQEVLLK
jgi:tripartite-type tricarboxylate transporter receptor subunit TctC